MDLFALAIGISSISTVQEGFANGRIYSVGIIFNVKSMIYRNDSPLGYWAMMGLLSIGCVGGIGLGVITPIGIVRAYFKRLARQKREKASGNL